MALPALVGVVRAEASETKTPPARKAGDEADATPEPFVPPPTFVTAEGRIIASKPTRAHDASQWSWISWGVPALCQTSATRVMH